MCVGAEEGAARQGEALHAAKAGTAVHKMCSCSNCHSTHRSTVNFGLTFSEVTVLTEWFRSPAYAVKVRGES